MITPSLTRTFVYPAPCDLRKGFNGLCGLVEGTLAQNVSCGAVFAFVNRRRNATKLLYFDGSGLVIVHKKLTRGRFAKVWDLERRHDGRLVLSTAELALLLEGGDVVGQRKKRDRTT